MDDRRGVYWFRTKPSRSRQQVMSGLASRGATSDIGEIQRVLTDELQRVIAASLDGRDREDKGLRAQVGAELRVRRIRIGTLDRLVVGRVDPSVVEDRVPRRLELGIAAVDEVGILDAIIVH